MDESLVGLFFLWLVNEGDAHGRDFPSPPSSYITALQADYQRVNYPVRHVQEVVHVNGQPKIVDLVKVVKREE